MYWNTEKLKFESARIFSLKARWLYSVWFDQLFFFFFSKTQHMYYNIPSVTWYENWTKLTAHCFSTSRHFLRDLVKIIKPFFVSLTPMKTGSSESFLTLFLKSVRSVFERLNDRKLSEKKDCKCRTKMRRGEVGRVARVRWR